MEKIPLLFIYLRCNFLRDFEVASKFYSTKKSLLLYFIRKNGFPSIGTCLGCKFWSFFVVTQEVVVYFILLTERFGSQIAPGATSGYWGNEMWPKVKRDQIFISKAIYRLLEVNRLL
jgi:hypothetical protein